MTHPAVSASIRTIRHLHLPNAAIDPSDNTVKTRWVLPIGGVSRLYRTCCGWSHRKSPASNVRKILALQISILLQTVCKCFPPGRKGNAGRKYLLERCNAIFEAWKHHTTHLDDVGGTAFTLPDQVYHMWQRKGTCADADRKRQQG